MGRKKENNSKSSLTGKASGTKENIVVIGSGIGGMASASLFARAGYSVTVLEMNDKHIGGHGRWLLFQGVKYSMGPQYVWEFNDGDKGDRFMDFIGIKSANPFHLMEENGFERIFIGDKEEEKNSCFVNFSVPLGLKNFRDEMISFFPEESDKLSPLFNDMIAVYNAYRSFFGNINTDASFLILGAKFLLSGESPLTVKLKLGRLLKLSVKEWFDLYGISSIPRRILYGHGGIFAESESQMSAIAYIIATGNYHRGARYPEKGYHHFFDSMATSIRENGGSVETGKKVVKLLTEKDRVTRAICSDGSEYPCDYIFSDISPRLTWSLLGRDTESFMYEASHSIPTICIGVKKGLPSIQKMKGRNYWWQSGTEVNYDNPDVTERPAMLFICSPTANGYGTEGKSDKDGLVVFCPGNYLQEKGIYSEGTGAIKKYKEKLAADIVDILDTNVFPGLKEKLIFAEAVSSIDIERETGGEMGNAYGKRLSVKEILKGAVKENNCPVNLFNVSATKNSPGIAGGIGTAVDLLKKITGITV